ncbi:MAG: Cof-type HAD-IIB family hydrolase [Lachnospiraceae bacterium]|nr:Cof-type HAD-IIB family hydrolase [Lachnospiraceae bacterium]
MGRFSGKILFTDMDETLLTTDKKISRAVYDAVWDFIGEGGSFVLSSGRPLNSIIETRDRLELPVKGTYIISYNGALVYDCDAHRPILEHLLSPGQVRGLQDLAKEMSIHVHTYRDEVILTPEEDEELHYYRRIIKLPFEVTPDLSEGIAGGAYKLLGIELKDHDRLDRFRERIEAGFDHEIAAFYSNPNYLEICLSKVSKGNAVRFLCDYLHCDIKHTLAAGDQYNDISMLEEAGIGFAMCNGIDALKDAADYVTVNDNNHDGILEAFTLLSQI